MAGSIDPRWETLRGIHWPVKVAGLFGTRVAETILASGPPNRINRPDIWMQAIRSDHQKLLRHGGRPHMGPRVRGDDAERERAHARPGSRPGRRVANFSLLRHRHPPAREPVRMGHPFRKRRAVAMAAAGGGPGTRRGPHA